MKDFKGLFDVAIDIIKDHSNGHRSHTTETVPYPCAEGVRFEHAEGDREVEEAAKKYFESLPPRPVYTDGKGNRISEYEYDRRCMDAEYESMKDEGRPKSMRQLRKDIFGYGE